jgi:hypothetical protein
VTETDEYILAAIRTRVWSGFYSPDEVDDMIGDLLEDDTDEAMLRAAVRPEFEAKAAAELAWPERTDCDRLDDAFVQLNALGVIALHNAGMTISDGISDVSEILHGRGGAAVTGYCFYHWQDVERAVDGHGLMIAFGPVDETATKKQDIGRLVKDVLERHDLVVSWNGDPETRLDLPGIDWKRRRSA